MAYIASVWITEFGPLGLFFVAFERWGFFAATKALIMATIAALLFVFWREKRIPRFPVAIALLVAGFGWATLYFQNPQFLMFEVTLYNALLAVGIIGGLIARRNLFRYLFGRVFAITEVGWNTLSLRWAAYFALQAVLNEFVRLHYSETEWVRYRILSLFVLGVFGLYQLLLTRRERLPEGNAWGLRIASPVPETVPVRSD